MATKKTEYPKNIADLPKLTDEQRRTAASRIKYLRRAYKISQGEFAKLIGKGQSTYCRVEYGQAPIRPDELVRYAGLLNTTIDYLLGLDDDPGPEATEALTSSGVIDGFTLADNASESLAVIEKAVQHSSALAAAVRALKQRETEVRRMSAYIDDLRQQIIDLGKEPVPAPKSMPTGPASGEIGSSR